MDQAQIETIIRDRIEELRALELTEHMHRLRLSLIDKRDELEALLLRIRALSTMQSRPPAGPKSA